MKTYFHAAAILLAFCMGCQSPNFLADRLGARDRLLQLKRADDEANPSRSEPSSPADFDPRSAATSAASVDEHLRLGELELSKDLKLEALGHFQKALEAAPQHAEANHRMAVVCDKLGEFDKAERHYTIALQNEARNVAVLSDLGYSYWLQGRHSESERFLLQALEVDPQYETAIANLGMLYGSTGRQDEALAMFRKIGEEAQVQQIMQQVAAMSASSQRPNESPIPAKGVTPAGLIDDFASQNAVRTASFETSRELSRVNEPTREILELMEQGRRQQQLADARHRQEGLPGQPPHPAQSFPLSTTRQPGEPASRQGPHPFGATPPPSGGGVPQRVPDHLLNQALADIDRQGRGAQPGRPITIGPNTPPQQFDARAGQAPQPLAVDHPQGAGPRPASNENWWDSNPQNSSAHIEAGPAPANRLNTTPQQASLTSQHWRHDSLPRSHAAPTAWQDQGPAPHAAISYGDPQLSSQFAEPRAVQPHNPGALQHAAGPMREPAASQAGNRLEPVPQPFEFAGRHQPLGAASPIGLPMGTSVAQIDPQSLATDSVSNSAANQWPAVTSAEAAPDDAYVQARRDAALMGLRAGPGELFPYVQHTQRATPGTASRWNGSEYPQPTRYMPPVPNSDPLIPVPPVAHAAAESFGQSQPLPYGVNRIHHPRQYDMRGSEPPGTVHQFTPQYREISQTRPPMGGSHVQGASHQPQAHSQVAITGTHNYGNQPHPSPYPTRAPSQAGVLHVYDDVRQQQNRQLNGLIHQTYGQSPQSPPYSVGAPLSHTVNTPAATANMPPPWNGRSSASVQSPAVGSYYTPPPGEANAIPSSASASSHGTASRTSTYVVPEPYHGQNGTPQRQRAPAYHSINQRSGDSYQGPTIVPSAP